MRLWKRDYEILECLERGLFCTGQLAQVFFSSRKKCAERMKKLFEEGFVGRFQKPLLDVRGKPEFVYCKKGKLVRGFAKVNHALAVSDFFVSFCQWKKRCSFGGTFFWCPLLEGLRPDGVLVVEKRGKKLLFFVEVDLGSENLSSGSYAFADKLDLYAAYFDSGKFRDDFKEIGRFRSFRLLAVFESGKRLHNFLKVAEERRADFVLASTLEKVKRDFKRWRCINGSFVLG